MDQHANTHGASITDRGSARLLAVVEVEKEQRIRCQQPGCNHTVYKAIHVVDEQGTLLVLGSTCFAKQYGSPTKLGDPAYGNGGGASADERRATDAAGQHSRVHRAFREGIPGSPGGRAGQAAIDARQASAGVCQLRLLASSTDSPEAVTGAGHGARKARALAMDETQDVYGLFQAQGWLSMGARRTPRWTADAGTAASV